MVQWWEQVSGRFSFISHVWKIAIRNRYYIQGLGCDITVKNNEIHNSYIDVQENTLDVFKTFLSISIARL